MMGSQGVQIDVRNELKPGELSATGRRQFKNQLSERLVTLSTFEYPTRRSFYDQKALDSRVAGLKTALEFAYSMGVTVVVGRIGRIPEDTSSTEFEILCQVMNDVARHSNRFGAVFAITPGADSAESIKALLERVTEGPLGINLDPCSLAMNGLDSVATYRALYDRVLAFQVRDGLRDIDGQGIEVPVGRGEVAWDELLALLQEGSYQGWMTVVRSIGDERISDAERAIRFVRHVVNDVE